MKLVERLEKCLRHNPEKIQTDKSLVSKWDEEDFSVICKLENYTSRD
jgi:hypothetical protein